MYKLDSGIVSIIATIAAIMIGIYSAIDGKQKEKKRRAALKTPAEDADQDDRIFNNPLDALFGMDRPQKDTDRQAEAERTKTGKTLDFFIDDDGELFSFASGAGGRGRTGVETVVEEPVQEKERVVYKTVEESVATRPVYDNGMDSIENMGLSLALPDADGEAGSMKAPGANRESSLSGLRERLKLNPQDLILFSEILKPKYKDF